MIIKEFINRLLSRLYWFYEKVTGETDEFMTFYYAIFAFSLFIVFYVWGTGLYIERSMYAGDFVFGKIEMIFVALPIFAINLFIFWKNKKNWEKLFRQANLQFNYYDIGVILYIFFAFLTFFYNTFLLGK